MSAAKLRQVSVKAYRAWGEDDAPRHSAALAFYLLLALSPLLLFLAALFAVMMQSGTAENRLDRHLLATVRDALGQEQATFLQSIMQSAANRHAGYLATALGVLVSWYGSSGLFFQLRFAVNSIWRSEKPRYGIGHWVLERVIAALTVILVGGILLGWLAFDSWLHIIRRSFGAGTPHGLRLFLSFFLAWCFWSPVYAALFKWLPSAKVSWRDVWLAGIVTSFSFAVLKLVLSLYFSFSSLSVSYGTAGAVIVILLWAFYSCQIFLYGIEFSKAWAERSQSVSS